jgi:hypothetical protein
MNQTYIRDSNQETLTHERAAAILFPAGSLFRESSPCSAQQEPAGRQPDNKFAEIHRKKSNEIADLTGTAVSGRHFASGPDLRKSTWDSASNASYHVYAWSNRLVEVVPLGCQQSTCGFELSYGF